jgi:hypothetical protein
VTKAPYEIRRYVGFVDLLGYKAIALEGDLTPAQRCNYLLSVFEALAQAAHDAAIDLAFPYPLRRVQFSDAFYFSSLSAVAVVVTMARFFETAYTMYEGTIDQLEGGAFRDWQPFLRGAIAYNWITRIRPSFQEKKYHKLFTINDFGAAGWRWTRRSPRQFRKESMNLRKALPQRARPTSRSEVCTTNETIPHFRLERLAKPFQQAGGAYWSLAIPVGVRGSADLRQRT